MRLNTISRKIWLGFGLIAGVLLFSGILVNSQTTQLAEHSRKVRVIREPTVESSFRLLNGVNESQAAIQNWFFLGDRSFLLNRKNSWSTEIEPSLERLKTLSSQWADEKSIESFEVISQAIKDFRSRQESYESLAAGQNRKVLREFQRELTEMAQKLRVNIETLVHRQNQLMNDDMAAQANLANNLSLSLIGLIAVGVFMCLLMGVLSIQIITRPIFQTIEFADALARGDFQSRFDIGGSLEIDRLKNSLESMRSSMELQTWLAQAQLKFNEAIRGAGNVSDLAKSAIETIARQIQAQVGVFYLAKGSKLTVAGTYAFPKELHPRAEIPVGQGLAGQAASSSETLIISGSGEKALPLDTMLGEIRPKEALALPLVHRDEVIGVMEFALSNDSRQRDQDLLKEISQSLAVTLDATVKNDQVQSLLHETQAQSEELQQQQEELRRANEELQTRQEELEATNEELEEQQTQLTLQKRTLDERNQELDQISRYKSEFLANMSHELRTPLNSQLILSNLLIENKEGNLTEKQLQYVQTIQATGLSLLELINDILDLSKVEAGKLTLEARDVVVKDMFAAFKSDFATSIEQKGLKFKIDIDPSVPEKIHTDQLRLTQILRNLISNAMKFTEQGQITLRAERFGDARDSVAHFIAFHVIDTGIGIPEDKQRAIFEAFEQVDSSVSRQYNGTGLGLAISKNLAKLLGGEIRLKSQEGKGSTFTLVIPQSLEGATHSESIIEEENIKLAPRNEDMQLGGDTVLIIEDDVAFAQMLAACSEEKDLRSIIAHDGAQGLKFAEDHLPSCILLDYQLPGLNGFKILKELKKNPATRHIPVYMISVDDFSQEAMKLGAVGYLVKPVKPKQINEALDKLMGVANKKIRRVLVVDDDPIQREQIIKIIGNGRLRSTGVATAMEAYEALQGGEHYECMVLDLKLPDFSGFELLEKIQKEKRVKCPPVIIYTAKELTRDEENQLRKYSDSIIIKGARSSERLLDEVSLFIHRVVRDLPPDQQKVLNAFYNPEKVFKDKKVLLVDDDVRNIFALCSALEEKGLEVVVARNGQEALDMLEENSDIHMVLMDVMMPVMDGYEATRRIRQNTQYQTLPIIALTAKAMREDKELCLQAGASDYLAKPVDMTRLLTLLRVWLSK